MTTEAYDFVEITRGGFFDSNGWSIRCGPPSIVTNEIRFGKETNILFLGSKSFKDRRCDFKEAFPKNFHLLTSTDVQNIKLTFAYLSKAVSERNQNKTSFKDLTDLEAL
jgi:hypothetical protein